jgi:hypothetical protein
MCPAGCFIWCSLVQFELVLKWVLDEGSALLLLQQLSAEKEVQI